ncbi:MAG TPA: MFS transporter [Phenylobacterium sp.]|nr:MFS transporter [Phenylobacterium sp.]
MAEGIGAAATLPAAERAKLLGYTGLLMTLVMLALPYGAGLIAIPVVFFLKNRLHLQAHEMAVFNAWTSVPLYVAAAFGLLRDRWSPFGLGDRGHLLLFGLLTAAIYAAAAFVTPTYGLLLAGLMLLTASIQTVLSSANGLFSAVGQAHLMPGQASAVLNIAVTIPAVAGFFLGGVFSQMLDGQNAVVAARSLFLAGAGLMAAIALLGAFGPRRLFTAHAEPRETHIAGDIVRLLKHGPIYAPLILWLLWNFAPSFGTALQYHLANTLHATDAQVGAFYAIFFGLYAPSFIAYGYLCQRVRLSKLLFWSTALAVPQMIPLLVVHTAVGALWAAVPMSLMGGLASAAYIDLAIRSCPKGLQGTMMILMASTAYFVALRFGDLLGTDIYDHWGGFTMTIVVATAVYALMLPTLLLAPRHITATTDGEASLAA